MWIAVVFHHIGFVCIYEPSSREFEGQVVFEFPQTFLCGGSGKWDRPFSFNAQTRSSIQCIAIQCALRATPCTTTLLPPLLQLTLPDHIRQESPFGEIRSSTTTTATTTTPVRTRYICHTRKVVVTTRAEWNLRPAVRYFRQIPFFFSDKRIIYTTFWGLLCVLWCVRVFIWTLPHVIP